LTQYKMVDFADPKITQTNGKYVVWLKKNQDNIFFFLNIKMKTY
jgi:hypothetical protein